jgi:octaprenyl-diphosphate synthase
VVEELRRILTANLPIIKQVNSHLLQMRGKLMRPTVLLLSNRAAGAPDDRVLTLAAVVELIHVATLVHDDSVDHSVLRRGLPTVNHLFSHQVSVIMGDYLYSRAVIELARLRDPEPLEVLARVTNEMTIGEMHQLGAVDRLAYREPEYDALIGSKTAALFAGACECGALKAAQEQRRALRAFGHAFGMLFQITDDLIDYTESEAVTGKPAGLDLKEHKVTLPLIAALPHMGEEARRDVEALFKTSQPAPAQIAQVVRLVEEHDGLEYARSRAATFADRANEELNALPETPAREALRSAVGYVTERRR